MCIAYTHHEPWKFGTGEVKLESNTLTDEFDLGISNVLMPDLSTCFGRSVREDLVNRGGLMVLDGSRDVLILDGDCGLCHRLAEFIDKRIIDRKQLAFRPGNSEDAELLFSKMPESLRSADTVYLIRKGRVYIRSIL